MGNGAFDSVSFSMGSQDPGMGDRLTGRIRERDEPDRRTWLVMPRVGESVGF